MSHFTNVQTKFTEKASLLQALRRLNLEPETTEKKVPIRGYKGRKGPKAEIRVPHEQFNGRYSEDMGFALQPDGSYTAIYSPHDLSPRSLGADFLRRLSEEYAIAEIERDGTYEIVERLEQGKFSVRKKMAYAVGGESTTGSDSNWSNYEA